MYVWLYPQAILTVVHMLRTYTMYHSSSGRACYAVSDIQLSCLLRNLALVFPRFPPFPAQSGGKREREREYLMTLAHSGTT